MCWTGAVPDKQAPQEATGSWAQPGLQAEEAKAARLLLVPSGAHPALGQCWAKQGPAERRSGEPRAIVQGWVRLLPGPQGSPAGLCAHRSLGGGNLLPGGSHLILQGRGPRDGQDSAPRLRGPPVDTRVDTGAMSHRQWREALSAWPSHRPGGWGEGSRREAGLSHRNKVQLVRPQARRCQAAAPRYQANSAFPTAGADSRKPQGGPEQRQENGPRLFIH